jgi:glycosyltransferase involved in cell wall biosynthesis
MTKYKVKNMKIAYFTTSEILGPQNAGGIQCSNRNISLLKSVFGESNVFICAVTKFPEYLNKATDNVAVFFNDRSKIIFPVINTFQARLMYTKKIEDRVLEHISQLNCDMIFIEISKSGFLQKRLPHNIKQILFMQNIEIDYLVNRIPSDPLRIFQYFIVKRNEALAVKNADAIISLSTRDGEQLKKRYKRSADLILPITMDDSFVKTDREEDSSTSKLKLLFVGSLFAPNEHGVTWLVDKVMPHVNAELSIAGLDFEKLTERLSRSNVNVIGTVDDLSVYYNNAHAIVSPILFGAGMKVKIAEALMYGKPVFATDEALEGYDVEGLANVYRCNTAQEFIEAINTYIDNPPYILFDENIRKRFLEKYDTRRYADALKELIGSV